MVAVRADPPPRQFADAIPKKRGPKTDVLEALLKRVDGLEQRLKEKPDQSPTMEEAPISPDPGSDPTALSEAPVPASVTTSEPKPKRPAIEIVRPVETAPETATFPPTIIREASPGVQPDALLDTYFSRLHARPYHIVDESSVRQRLRMHRLPRFLIFAIYAVSAR
jgi:hypothetical protein